MELDLPAIAPGHSYTPYIYNYANTVYTSFNTLMKESSGTKEDSKLRNVSDLL